MTSLWNLLSPTRSGVIKISGSGYELFGTVVKHGLIDKTVTVRVSSQRWNNKYKRFMHTFKNKLVHDELNYCTSGDKVIIQVCKKLSKQKAYYVKNIVKPFGRYEFERNVSEEPEYEPGSEAEGQEEQGGERKVEE